MEQAKQGDTVQVHYTGRLEDGTVFDTSDGSDPLEFTVGAGEVIPGFEDAVVGMNAGEQKTETITPERAYGPHRDELVFAVGKDQIPDGMVIEVGDVLRIGFGDGETGSVRVAEVGDSTITLDANHPLAGMSLVFDLQLVGIGG